MNKTTHLIFTFFHYSLMIRDTLEYTLNKQDKDYSLDAYNQRKNILVGMLNNPSPLKDFLKNNPEAGEKIERQLKEFIDDVYSDNSTVVRVTSEGLRVDHAQHIKIYNYVVGLYETISDIVYGYINYSKTINEYEESFEKAVDLNNKFYRGIAYMSIVDSMDKTFKEFNDAMKESKGQPSPASNFLSNDLKSLVGFLRFVREHNKFNDDPEIKTFLDSTEDVVQMMGGKKPIPAGKNLFQIADDNAQSIRVYVAKKEPENNASLQALFKEITDFELANQNGAKSEEKPVETK